MSPQLTVEEKARRYDALVKHMKKWPYSPYTEMEQAFLVRDIRRLIAEGRIG